MRAYKLSSFQLFIQDEPVQLKMAIFYVANLGTIFSLGNMEHMRNAIEAFCKISTFRYSNSQL